MNNSLRIAQKATRVTLIIPAAATAILFIMLLLGDLGGLLFISFGIITAYYFFVFLLSTILKRNIKEEQYSPLMPAIVWFLIFLPIMLAWLDPYLTERILSWGYPKIDWRH